MREKKDSLIMVRVSKIKKLKARELKLAACEIMRHALYNAIQERMEKEHHEQAKSGHKGPRKTD